MTGMCLWATSPSDVGSSTASDGGQRLDSIAAHCVHGDLTQDVPNWMDVMRVLRSRTLRNLQPSDSHGAGQPSDASHLDDFSVQVQTGIEHAYWLSQSRRRPFMAANTAEKRYRSASSVDFVTSRLQAGSSHGAPVRLIRAGWVLTPDASITGPALLKRIEHASSYCRDAGMPLFILTGVEQ